MFGRQIPQILLIHDNAAEYGMSGRTADKLEKRGYKFVSLDMAMADPAYATPDLYVGTGILWMDRWKLALGMKLDLEQGAGAAGVGPANFRTDAEGHAEGIGRQRTISAASRLL